jgi:restriction system protein
MLELKAMGGEARFRDIVAAVEPKLGLTEWELGNYDSGPPARWQKILLFYSIDCVKAGWLSKSAGRWQLTETGEAALKLEPEAFIRKAQEYYRAWRKNQPQKESEPGVEPGTDEVTTEEFEIQLSYELAREQAQEEIAKHVIALGPYEFQDAVAALLEAMGYSIPYIAAPGPDGGVDIHAYKDPLGTTTPRIVVQVKHRTSKLNAKELRELSSLIRKDGDVGLIVSSGGFTSDAQREMQLATRHIEFMDLDRFIDLWQQYYDKISDKGRKLLPLVKLYFLAPPRE